MSDSDPKEVHPQPDAISGTPPLRKRMGRRTRLTAMAMGGVALLAVGAMAGAGALSLARPQADMAPAIPVAIAAMPDWGIVTIKGQVAEIFGGKFVVQDSSGRALVETGPVGASGRIVAKDEAVTVQGRFENGFIHARFIVHADGRTETLGPADGPPRPPLRAWLHRLIGENDVLVPTIIVRPFSANG